MIPVRNQTVIGAIGAYWRAEHIATQAELKILVSLAAAAAAVL
jgi:hypothetical protein